MKINPGHGFYPICLCAPFLHILTLNFINDQTHLTENNPVAAINLYEKWYYATHFIYFQGF